MWKMPLDDIFKLWEMDLNHISTWREHGGQPYMTISDLKKYCSKFDLQKTPVLFEINSDDMPISIKDVYDQLLCKNIMTKVNLDKEAGHSEGFVIRTEDRRFIKKIRFEEYEKTLDIKNK